MICVGLFKLIYNKPFEKSIIDILRFESNVFINGFKTILVEAGALDLFESNVFLNK